MSEPVTQFLSRLEGVRKVGPNQWTAKCPAHEDEHPSLSVSEGEDCRLLARCHAGCEFEDILSAVAWRKSDAFDASPKERRQRRTSGRPRTGRVFSTDSAAISHIAARVGGQQTGVWVYRDATGDEAFRVLRFDGCGNAQSKEYRPLHRANEGWCIADPPGILPLYRLPELMDATTIWVCEGEKCVEILRKVGFAATTNAHGANAAAKTDWTPLAGKHVILCPDRGAAGEAHTKAIVEHLRRLTPAPTVKAVRLPVTNDGDDIEQFVEASRARGISEDDIRRELERLAQEAPGMQPAKELVIVRLSDVTPEAQPYLWPGRIPSASCTLIGGRQGDTKNLFAYDVMARVTTGSPWPDDPAGDRRAPRNVILLEAEEHLESSIVPRLGAAGADLSRVHFIKGAPTHEPDRTRFISIQCDAGRIESAARQVGDVALVVVSPITSYLGDIEQNSNEQVRNEVIHPLKALAEELGCAVIIIKHPNKDWKNTDPLSRIGGSAAWTEAMRCVVFIGRDPDEAEGETNPRRCAHWIKFSIGPTPPPISWRIQVSDSGVPFIGYVSDPVTFTAAEMLAGRRDAGKRKTKRDTAAEWIVTVLEHGPVTAGDFKAAAVAAVDQRLGFSLDAIERARKDLRDAGRVAFERKPDTSPAEWWYWVVEGGAPDWHAAIVEADATSAAPARACTPTHAEVAEVEPEDRP